jgi:hypothetical protein
MTIFLDRIDAVPVLDNDFPYQFNLWLSVLVDTLNEIVFDLENLFNELGASLYTSAEIAALFASAEGLPNGVLLYDTTLNEYVGQINGALVKFTTTAYP